MSDPRVTKPKRYILMAVMLVVLGVVTLALTTPQSVRVPVVVGTSVAAGLLFVIISIIKASKRAARKTALAFADMCAQYGLVHRSLGKNDDKETLFAPFKHLDQLRTGSKGLAWIALDPTGTNPLVLLQHNYVVSTGQTTIQVTHTLAAQPCPVTWPMLKLTPENLGHRLAGMFGKGDLQLESDEFNTRWFVKADDEDFTVLVLSLEMQKWLIDAPKWAIFQIGNGQIVCTAKKTFKPDALPELIELHTEFARRIPPELQAWAPRA